MADDRSIPSASGANNADGDLGQRIATYDYAEASAPRLSTPLPGQSRRGSGSTTMSSSGHMPPRREPLDSQPGGAGSSDSVPRRSRPQYGTMQSGSVSIRSPMSPSAAQFPPRDVPKRPGTVKRATSHNVAPHRGDRFSVDDHPDEVNEDMWLEHQSSKQQERAQLDRQVRRRGSTLRRRPTAQPPALARVISDDRGEDEAASETAKTTGNDLAASGGSVPPVDAEPSSDDTLQGQEEEEEEEEVLEEGLTGLLDDETPAEDDDDEVDASDAESFTLKDRQEAINETHPFGIRIWKPALYKKNRSVQRNAEGDIHSTPGGHVSSWLFLFNCLWTVIFGWWLGAVAMGGGIVCLMFSVFQLPGCAAYGRVLVSLAKYIFYPFGSYVKLEHDEAYLEEDEGEGRSVGEYERWQTGELEEGRLFFGPTDINRSLIGRRRDSMEDQDETASLLGRQRRDSPGGGPDGNGRSKLKKRLFGRGKWNPGRVIFFCVFYFLLTPLLFLVSGICWFLVFTIPMGKVTLLLFYHLRRHPLALSFNVDAHYSRAAPDAPSSSILLCTYRAVGAKYWKYTIDGTNIFLINLLGLVAFTIIDYFVLGEALHVDNFITSDGFVFILGLASIIPLAYFIGQAVASISAQSSMGLGATINAFFSTVVEVFLYCVALNQGKSQLVEGSIIGSIFAGILFLPGLSMCFGALKRKTQRFNVKSAGVTSTMLLFAVIGGFGPTLFYQIYGSHELNCFQCASRDDQDGVDSDCRRCYFAQVPDVTDRFWTGAVRPYTWIAAVLLFLSYVIGLMFTLRTHAAVIWHDAPDEKKETIKAEQAVKLQQQREHGRAGSVSGGSVRHLAVPGTVGLVSGDDGLMGSIRGTVSRATTSQTLRSNLSENVRDSTMYNRILHQSLRSAGLEPRSTSAGPPAEDGSAKGGDKLANGAKKQGDSDANQLPVPGLSAEDNRALIHQVAEMATTAAIVAAIDAKSPPPPPRHHRRQGTGGRKEHHGSIAKRPDGKEMGDRTSTLKTDAAEPEPNPRHDGTSASQPPMLEQSVVAPAGVDGGGAHGGHDAPNWSRTKSAIILLTATVAYAVIAEILVDTVDAVLSNVAIDQKFLGITLFALVPNTTEFLNAISFAMNGNIALSMEIGSAYALQVILLQIPALVLYTAVSGRFTDAPADDIANYTFSLIFPQWDMVTVILAVFLMGYVLGEGKSNYFKGSSLILTYFVVVVGFWFGSYTDLNAMGVDRFDKLALNSNAMAFRTIGQKGSGVAYPVGR